MEAMWSYIGQFNEVSIFIRLTLAVILGGIVGAERGAKHQAAGMRTFALVCLGSAMAMVINEYLAINSDYNIDPSRMAAQVISGIGFLGVGTIIVTDNNRVRGLTTAATLWSVAMLGLAIGSGFLYGAIVGFLFIMISVKLLQKFSKKLENYSRCMEIYMEIAIDDGMKRFLAYLDEKEYAIRSLQRKHQKALYKEDACICLEIDLKNKCNHQNILNEIEQIKGVHYIEEIK